MAAPRLSKSRRLPCAEHDRDCAGHPRFPLQALGAIRRLNVHVLDVDLFDHAALGRERESRAGLVRVHVHLDRARSTDHEERVAELRQLPLEILGVDVLPLHEEGGAVAVAGELLVHGLERDPGRERRELWERLAAHVRRDPAQDLEHACPARVDDARFTEDVQLIGRCGEGRLAVRDEVGEHLLHRRVGRHKLLRLLGQGTGDGQHRPFLRIANGRVTGIARPAKGTREGGRVDLGCIAESLDGAADELREDHPGVAARAHERGADDVGVRIAIERGDHRARGLGHVRARVPVRDRVDVQVVDAGPARLERRQSGAREP